MWLIDTTSLELVKFQECPAKKYAILSHTWGADAEELDFDEFKAGRGRDKIGFEKIRLCCEQAKKDGISYAWVDTCCINKQNNTELSEAINSMFAWYAKSKICYVYLVDVGHRDTIDALLPGDHPKVFEKSRWFTRGWTLQELVAPKVVIFFTKEWIEVGDKVHMAGRIHSVTGIDTNVLMMRKSFLDCSIAQRMRWASPRTTTRLEDSAYCLIGLFDVNLPMMYGEGSKAFLRLQQKIIEQTDDETIFAWTNVPEGGSGLLAPSAAHFVGAANIHRQPPGRGYRERPHYFNTNKGLLFQCQLIPYEMNTYIVPLLCCWRQSGKEDEPISIFLVRTTKDDQYRRVSCRGQSLVSASFRNTTNPFIRQTFVPDDGRGLQLAPCRGLPTLHLRSRLQTWHLDEVGFVEQRTHLPDNVRHRSGGDVETGSTYTPEQITNRQRLIRCMPRIADQISFSRTDLRTGVVIACKRSCGPSASFSHYLKFAFDKDFQPECILFDGNFSYSRLWYIFWQITSWSYLWEETSSDIANLRRLDLVKLSDENDSSVSRTQKAFTPYFSRGEGVRFKHVNLEEVSFTLPTFLCTYIEVSFRPLGELEYEMTIEEKRAHKRRWRHLKYCHVCLLAILFEKSMHILRLSQAFMLLGLIPSVVAGWVMSATFTDVSFSFAMSLGVLLVWWPTFVYGSFAAKSVFGLHTRLSRLEQDKPRKKPMFHASSWASLQYLVTVDREDQEIRKSIGSEVLGRNYGRPLSMACGMMNPIPIPIPGLSRTRFITGPP